MPDIFDQPPPDLLPEEPGGQIEQLLRTPPPDLATAAADPFARIVQAPPPGLLDQGQGAPPPTVTGAEEAALVPEVLAAPGEIQFEQPPGVEAIPLLAPGAQPPLLEQPAPTPLVETSSMLQDRGRQLDQIAGGATRIGARLDDLRTRYAQATDEGERAELAARITPLAQANEELYLAQNRVRNEAADLADIGAVQLAGEQAKVTAAQQEELRRRLQDSATEAEAKRLEAQRAKEQAQTRLETDQRAYRELLTTEPKMAIGPLLASMFAESINAAVEKRQPRFDNILSTHAANARTVYESRARRALSTVELGGDEVTRRAVELAEVDAQEQAGRATIIAEAEAELARRLERTAEPFQQAELANQLSAVRQERERQQLLAQEARRQADIKTRGAMADVALTEAKIGREQALTEKALQEARKAGRRGGGAGAGVTAPGLIAANVVTYPDSDEALISFSNDASGRKEAATTRAIIAGQVRGLDRIARIERLYEDAEKSGILASAGWDRSGEKKDLETELALLRNDLALVKSGGLATTEGDDKWAGRLVPDSPKSWSSKTAGMRQITAVKNAMENEARLKLSGETRLNKTNREKVIAASRPKAVSKKDRAVEERAQAYGDLTGRATSTTRKLTAVEQIEQNARQEAANRGSEEDWLPLTIVALSDALDTPAVRADKNVRAAIREKLDKYETFATERSELAAFQVQDAEVSAATLGGGVPDTSAEKTRQARAEAIRQRAARAKAKDVFRDATPEMRRAMRNMPGMREIIDEIEAEGTEVVEMPAELVSGAEKGEK